MENLGWVVEKKNHTFTKENSTLKTGLLEEANDKNTTKTVKS